MKRGRNQRRRQGVNPNRALDSNGPEVRIRGTANQIYDKYTALARDASSSGDRIKAENYLQHAEHYFRVIRSMQQSQQSQQPQQQQPQSDGEGDQPAVDDSDEQPRKGPRRGNGRDRRAAEDKSAGAAEESSNADAPANDSVEANTEEAPKKPRRRRVKRAEPAAEETAAADKDAETPTAAAE